MEIKNVELLDLSSFLPTSSLIISSSVNSSKSTETENLFSRYSNVVRIGNGAFGSVFKAIDTKQNKLKAIKVVKLETFTDLNTVMKEASQLSNVKHPNIVKLNDYCISNDNLLIVDMDFYEFGDLTKLMKQSPCNKALIKQILKQMLQALKYIHEDLNIIIGKLKL